MSYQIIGESNFKKFFQNAISKQYMVDTKIECFDNAIIANEHEHGFGVFDKDYNFVKSSLQMRKNNGQFIPEFSHDNIPYVDSDVIFIGNVYPHFGHFLLEHMNRLYALLDDKYKNRKVVLINNYNIPKVPEYMINLIKFMGVKSKDIIILNQTTRFKSVCVPSQSFNTRIYSSKSFAETFDKIAENIPDTEIYDKIYVSRAALDMRHKVFGEEKVQKVFEKNGFKVIYPETLPLKEQISLIKNCRVLAGCAGTALHLALFMKKGGRVIQIKRNRLPKCNARVQNLINNTKNLDGVFISASIEKQKTEHGAKSPQIIGINKYMKQFFDENNFKYSPSDLKPDNTAWKEYSQILSEYKKSHGNAFVNKLKFFVIKYSALFVPGRERRGRYRKFLKEKLNFEK